MLTRTLTEAKKAKQERITARNQATEFELFKKHMNDVLAAQDQILRSVQSELLAKTRDINDIRESNERLRTDVQSRERENGGLTIKLDGVIGEVNDTRGELTRFIKITQPLLLRILIDKARKKILNKTTFGTWTSFYTSFPNQAACQQNIQNITSLPDDLARFISEPNSKLRRKGNIAAHHAEEGAIWGAVERTHKHRSLLERTFQFVFNTEGPDNVEDEEENLDDDVEAQDI